jgi:hypothetical protein
VCFPTKLLAPETSEYGKRKQTKQMNYNKIVNEYFRALVSFLLNSEPSPVTKISNKTFERKNIL